MTKKIIGAIDYVAIAVGFISLLINFFLPDDTDCQFLRLSTLIITTLFWSGYIIYAVYLSVKRSEFDWHLINGHFLRKVCCLVILMPSFLALFGYIIIESPKELSYHQELYQYHDNDLERDITRRQESPDIFWTTYYHFIDPGNQHMTTTKAGRILAAIIAILGVFLVNGLLVSSLVGSIDTRKERWLKGEVKYNTLLNLFPHYVVIGANDMVDGIIHQLLNRDYKNICKSEPYILIQTAREVESFRRALFSNLTPAQQRRIIIYYGDRTSKVDICDLHLKKALEVYVLGEDTRTDDIESYHDTINMECIKLISSNIEDYTNFRIDGKDDRRLVCRVMFEYQTSFNIIQVTDINLTRIKFLPFNYYEKWAQNVLLCHQLENNGSCEYTPLEGFGGIKSKDDDYVHLVVVGMSRMGIAMAIEAAHIAHYPNYESRNKRTRITFIDKNAKEEKEFFMSRFKNLFSLSHWRYGDVIDNELIWGIENDIQLQEHLGGDFLDIEWEFINSSVESPAIQQYLVDSSRDKFAKLTIAICIAENNSAIAAAVYLPDEIYHSDNTIQVLVYQRLNNELVRQISDNDKSRYRKKIKAFGMAKECYNSDLVELSEYIAKKLSDAYNDYGWAQVVERFNGNGLTDEDFDNLTDGIYRSYPDKKEEIQSICNQWMNTHHQESDYSKVKEAKEDLTDKLKSTCIQQGNRTESGGKTVSAKMWSNYYNIYTMWTKFRCITTSDGHTFNPLKETFDSLDSDMMNELGQMEHNRWNVEQLLLRYRPLTKEEQDEAKILSLYDSALKKNFYKAQFAHLNICSNRKLDEIDYKISQLDKELIAVIPSAYKQYCNRND